jgi:hypothetical protein
MSNCDFVAGRSRIDLVASRLSHRALALCAVSALTRPNQSVQRLPRLLTMKDVGPHDVITKHCVEHCDHLAHDLNDHDACGASRTGRHAYNRFVRPNHSRVLALVARRYWALRDNERCNPPTQ